MLVVPFRVRIPKRPFQVLYVLLVGWEILHYLPEYEFPVKHIKLRGGDGLVYAVVIAFSRPARLRIRNFLADFFHLPSVVFYFLFVLRLHGPFVYSFQYLVDLIFGKTVGGKQIAVLRIFFHIVHSCSVVSASDRKSTRLNSSHQITS